MHSDITTGVMPFSRSIRQIITLDVNVERVALRKVRQLQAASQLDDLKVPPGNMLEPLHGDRQGQHSIRINKQFRVCFRWTKVGAEDVEIVDYH